MFAIFAGGIAVEAWMARGRARRWVTFYPAVVVLGFLFYLPVVLGIPLPQPVHGAIIEAVPGMDVP